MKTEPAPPLASLPAPLWSYLKEFENWMRNSPRCRYSPEFDDLRQEIRLALWESKDVPATWEEARGVFLRMTSRVAQRQVLRQGTLVELPEDFAECVERDILRSLALLNALEKLSDQERWLVKECKIDGRTCADVAHDVGVTEDAVRNRLWRAMARLLAIFEGENNGKREKRGAIIAPLAFEFTDLQRAAFSTIWHAERRVPMLGGGPPNPPGPPPVAPGAPPVAVAPVVSAAVKSAVSAVTIAIVVVLLFLVPTSIVAIYYFWDPPRVQTAEQGLRAPPVTVIEDVVPMYVAPSREQSSVQSPAASSSAGVQAPAPLRSSAVVRSNEVTSSSPPLDPKEVERARRRRQPRFLPSR